MSKRAAVLPRGFVLGLACLCMSYSVLVFAQERMCPDGQRSYFGVCPGEQSRPEPQPRPGPQPRPEPQPRPDLPLPQINVNGSWRDPTWGIMSKITQQGETFHYTAWGPSCIGGTFQSSGSGTIRGNFVESRYQALINFTIRSEGRCSGTMSPDGMRITSTCNDSVCGQFTSSGVRQ